MKRPLDVEVIVMRIVQELKDGDVVNIGYGLGDAVSNYLPVDKTIIMHCENGVYGYGRLLTEGEENVIDPYLYDVGGHFLAPSLGMSFGDVGDALDAIHNGRVNTTILGAYQVSERGDLANWTTDPQGILGDFGGAIDMAMVQRVIVAMKHVTKRGEPRIVKQCTYALTGRECVDLIITDLAVIEVTKSGLLLREIAPGWAIEDIQAVTEPRLIIDKELKEVEL